MSTEINWNQVTPAEAVGQVGCTSTAPAQMTLEFRPSTPCPTCGRCPTCQPWQQFPSYPYYPAYPYRPFEITCGLSVPAFDQYTMVMN